MRGADPPGSGHTRVTYRRGDERVADEQDRPRVPVQVTQGFFDTGLRWPPQSGRSASAVTVLVALGVNVLVAGVKSVVAVITGSASLGAEAAHSWADTGNEVFLVVANRRSARPPDRTHPLGHGREAYVWALLAAVGLFVTGASVSVWHGFSTLLHGESHQGDYRLAYIVLAIALVMEGSSLLRAVRQLRGEARIYHRDLLEHALVTSDPTTRAVFAEDTAAVIGIVIAFFGIGLHQLTGNARWDAAGSILVGVLLAVVAVLLIDRNRRFLTGEPGSPELYDAVVARIRQLPDVAEVRFVRLVFVGPKRLFLVASVDLVGDPVESHVAHTLRRLERELETNPQIVDAVLTIAEPDEGDEMGPGGVQ
jgi:cation diffusion facilitator family transporter